LADGLKGDLALILLIAAPQHANLVVGHGPPTKRWTCHVLTHPHLRRGECEGEGEGEGERVGGFWVGYGWVTGG
jgi:hypothetical protein